MNGAPTTLGAEQRAALDGIPTDGSIELPPTGTTELPAVDTVSAPSVPSAQAVPSLPV